MLEQIIPLEVECIQWLEQITPRNWMHAVFGTDNFLQQNSFSCIIVFQYFVKTI